MALICQSQLELAALILAVFLGLSSTGEGVKQELWLYKEDGNNLYFHTHVPDLTEYSATLPKITKICASGLWVFYKTVNYHKQTWGFGSLLKNDVACTSYPLTTVTVKSVRHWAAKDTATDALNLYSGTNYEGDEILVTRARTDISTPVLSLAASCTADWMLYEGKNLNGKSICYQVPRPGYVFAWNETISLKIGSVFKGCDLHEINLYKESLSF